MKVIHLMQELNKSNNKTHILSQCKLKFRMLLISIYISNRDGLIVIECKVTATLTRSE